MRNFFSHALDWKFCLNKAASSDWLVVNFKKIFSLTTITKLFSYQSGWCALPPPWDSQMFLLFLTALCNSTGAVVFIPKKVNVTGKRRLQRLHKNSISSKSLFEALLTFEGSYAYWCEANQLTGHLKLYLQARQQSFRQRRPFANDKREILTEVIKVTFHPKDNLSNTI